MKEQIIQLEAHDDVTSIRDKFGWIRAPRVLLVFPDDPGIRLLQQKLDLLLIHREATRRRAQLAVITRDPVVIDHARELGIAHFRSIEASHKTYWRTEQARIEVDRTERPAQLDNDLVTRGTRLEPRQPLLSPRLQKIASGLLFVVLGAGVLGAAYTFLPGATVHLTPATNQVTITTTVLADPEATDIDLDAGIIPARLVGVEVEASTEVETTGTAEIPSEKARGVVLFTNLVPDQITIPAGTIVRTSAARPVRFTTLVEASLPGQIGETIEVPVEALEAGFEGNIPASRVNQIEGLLASRVAVTNTQATRGGEVVESPAISEQDFARVRTLLIQQLQQRAFAEMQTNPFIDLQENEFIPLESLAIVLIHSETYQGFEGEAADQVGLTMRVTIQGVAIDERLARRVVYDRLSDKVGPGFQIGSESLIYRQGEVTGIDEDRRVEFVMQGAGDVSLAIAQDEIQRMVRGRTIDEALRELDQSLPLASSPVIDVWPGFWPIMPSMPFRIRIEVTGQAS